MRDMYWWVFGFVSALAMTAVLQKFGINPGWQVGWWFLPLVAAYAGFNAHRTSR